MQLSWTRLESTPEGNLASMLHQRQMNRFLIKLHLARRFLGGKWSFLKVTGVFGLTVASPLSTFTPRHISCLIWDLPSLLSCNPSLFRRMSRTAILNKLRGEFYWKQSNTCFFPGLNINRIRSCTCIWINTDFNLHLHPYPPTYSIQWY